MIDLQNARVWAIAYRRQMLQMVDKIERDFGLGKYAEVSTIPETDKDDPEPESKTPDTFDVLSKGIDTENKTP